MKRIMLCALVLTAAIAAAAQDSDHNDLPGTEALFARSAFAHGFSHGYEEGFHHANIALHMARQRKDADDALGEAKLSTVYQRKYGDRRKFLLGFREGFTAGYEDAFDARPYRAIETLRLVGDGLVAGTSRTRTFDEGFIAGLEVFRKNPADYSYSSSSIPALVQHCQENGLSAEYCEGHARGIRFATLQPTHQVRTQTASK